MRRQRAILAALALPLAACSGADFAGTPVGAVFGAASPETRQLAAPPAPAGPAQLSSMMVTSLVDGTRSRLDVRRFGSGWRVREESGCTWTRPGDWFAPSDSWAGCGDSAAWSDARARTTVVESPYPLRDGARGEYRRQAVSHTGATQDRTTRCEVVGAEAVRLPGGGDVPAWVVACDDGKRLRTTWYAPGQGPVAFRQTHPDKGVEEAWVRQD